MGLKNGKRRCHPRRLGRGGVKRYNLLPSTQTGPPVATPGVAGTVVLFVRLQPT